MSRIPVEQETSIVFNEAEETALVWSASARFQRKMARLGVEPYQATPDGCWYRVLKTWITVRSPTHRQLSDEQRAAMSQRARVNLARPAIGAGDTVIH